MRDTVLLMIPFTTLAVLSALFLVNAGAQEPVRPHERSEGIGYLSVNKSAIARCEGEHPQIDCEKDVGCGEHRRFIVERARYVLYRLRR